MTTENYSSVEEAYNEIKSFVDNNFDLINEQLKILKENKTTLNRDLTPADYYNGVDNFDTAGTFDGFSQEFSETLTKFKEYIENMEIANDDGDIPVVPPLEEDNNGNAILGFLGGVASSVSLLPITTFTTLVKLFQGFESGFSAIQNNLSTIPTEEDLSSKKKGGYSDYSGYSSGYGESSYTSESSYADEEDVDEFDLDDGEVDGEIEDDSFGDEVEEFEFEEDDSEEEDLTEEEGVTETDEEDVTEIDVNGNEGGSVGENKVIDEIKDSSGNVVAIAVIGNGKKTWYQVVDGNVIMPNEVLSTYNLKNPITITIDGTETTINSGSYNVDQVIYNADGTIRSVRFIAGENKVWAYLDGSGNIIKTEYIRKLDGMFSITNPNFDMIDVYGNNIGKFTSGDKYVYQVLYDSKGNAIAYRLTPDGEYEKWLYPNGNTTDGTATIYNNIQNNDGSSIATLGDDTTGGNGGSSGGSNKGLYGLLGILFVALGTTLVVRKKIKDKENAEYNDDYSSDVVEENLSAGNYGVYDVKKDDDGKITEARINPVDSSDEYWVEV